MDSQLIFDARAQLGEGALWHNDRLLWVDIDGCTLHRFNPLAGTDESWHLGQRVGTVVPRRAGGYVVGLHRGIARFDPNSSKLTVFADPAPGRDDLRCNDGKCDPAGRFFVGLMGLSKPRPPGSLFRIDPDGSVTRVIDETGTSNGLAWSADRTTMYFIDTPTREVSAFDYDIASGEITNRRPAVRLAEEAGRPDGMTIDSDDNLWIALYDGGCVLGCDPRTGEVFERINVPAKATTSCAFGGENLSDLFITTGRSSTEPMSGGIFVARPGARGVPAFEFAG